MLDDKARLQHIFDAIIEIEGYMENHTEDDFFNNSMLHSACIRQLEIIGEAAGRESGEIRAESADIPWKEIIDLRNILIHEYFGIDLDIVGGELAGKYLGEHKNGRLADAVDAHHRLRFLAGDR